MKRRGFPLHCIIDAIHYVLKEASTSIKHKRRPNYGDLSDMKPAVGLTFAKMVYQYH